MIIWRPSAKSRAGTSRRRHIPVEQHFGVPGQIRDPGRQPVAAAPVLDHLREIMIRVFEPHFLPVPADLGEAGCRSPTRLRAIAHPVRAGLDPQEFKGHGFAIHQGPVEPEHELACHVAPALHDHGVVALAAPCPRHPVQSGFLGTGPATGQGQSGEGEGEYQSVHVTASLAVRRSMPRPD